VCQAAATPDVSVMVGISYGFILGPLLFAIYCSHWATSYITMAYSSPAVHWSHAVSFHRTRW